jgi:peroxiredoxin
MTQHPSWTRTLLDWSRFTAFRFAIVVCIGWCGCSTNTTTPENGGPTPPSHQQASVSPRDSAATNDRIDDSAPEGSAHQEAPSTSDTEGSSGSSAGSGQVTPEVLPSEPTPSPLREDEQPQNGTESPVPQFAGLPPAAPPPAEVHKPEVILSERHLQTCRVGVGDSFPALTLPDQEGASHDLSQLMGDRMTIVVFWNSKNMYAREQFSRIMKEAYDRYAALGVKVVTINVGDTPEVVQNLVAEHKITTPCLIDVERKAFEQVANDLLPRTYLLDAEGKILWFDLEYSRSQRLSLHNAVHYQLKQGGV